jgi:hypothetical protein
MPEKYRDAPAKQRDAELEARFLSAFGLARKLR